MNGKMGIQTIDISGKRYTRWTVVSYSHKNDHGETFWNCVCDCGNTRIKSKSNLRNGVSKSCGCLKRDRTTKPFGYSTLATVYDKYIRNAKSRGLLFDISIEDFVKITSKNCFYCGKPPSNIKKSESMNGDFVYSGIDRLENSKGYIKNNVVACCKICNQAKKNYSSDFFFMWINSILDNSKILLGRFGGKHAVRQTAE